MTLRFLFPPSVCVKSNYEFLQRAELKGNGGSVSERRGAPQSGSCLRKMLQSLFKVKN